MTGLASLHLRTAYHKPVDNIAADFYLPCLARAHRYDRAVGFFSSAIYALAWSSLRTFVENGGRIRLICSPVLSDADIAAMGEGYSARVEAEEDKRLRAEMRRVLSTPGLAKPSKVLASLIALGIDPRFARLQIRFQ